VVLELQGQPVNQGLMGSLDPLAMLGHRDRRVLREVLVLQDKEDSLEEVEHEEQREQQDSQVQQEVLDLPDHQELLVSPAQLDLEETPAL